MAEIGDLNTTDASNTARFTENQAPGTVNDGGRALEGLLARAFKDTIDGFITTGGSSTAYTAASNRTLSAYYDGLMLMLQFHTASGATPTLNVDAVGAQSLVYPDGTAVGSTEIPTSMFGIVMYDASNTNWVVLTSSGIVTAATLGLVIGTNVQAWDAQLDDIAALSETKGNIITNTGAAWTNRAVGANDTVLTADSTEPDGVKWASSVTITAGSTLTMDPFVINTTTTQAHGLAAEPNDIKVIMECKVIDRNYAVGDRILISSGDINTAGSVAGLTFLVDATNVVMITNSSNTLAVLDKTTRTPGTITASSWKIIAVPYLYS